MRDRRGSAAVRSARRATALILAALTLAGCYRTTPLPGPTPEPGTRIVAQLTPGGAERMADLIGPDAVGVEAHLVEARPAGWELSLLRVDHRRGSTAWAGERVTFPEDALRGVRERRLDQVRTGAFVAGVGVVAVVLARAFLVAFVNSDSGGGGTDPVQ